MAEPIQGDEKNLFKSTSKINEKVQKEPKLAN
jgi:hypothetical protein